MRKFIGEKYDLCKNAGKAFYEKYVKGGIKPYLWLFLLIFVLYFSFFTYRLDGTLDTLRRGLNITIIVLFVVFLFFFIARIIRNRLTVKYFIAAALAAAVIMRLYYMLTNSTGVHSHDVWRYGHTGYMEYFFNGFSLPESNMYQFYQPPFFHIMSGIMMRIGLSMFPQASVDQLFGASYIVNTFASIVFLIFSLKLLKELGLKGKFLLLAFCFLAFNYGTVIILGFMNNDMLSLMFFLLSIYFSVKWYKNPDIKTTVLIALFFGLGAMTKTSGMLSGILIAAIFLTKYFKQIKSKQPKTGLHKKYIGLFSIFAVIAVPLALWFSIRQLVLFGQPFGYVMRLANTHWPYVGDQSFVSRFLTFPFWLIFETPFVDFGAHNGNVWLQTLKTFSFGEFYWNTTDTTLVLAKSLVFFNLLFIILIVGLAIVGLIYAIKHKKLFLIYIAIFSFIYLLSYIGFQIGYPHLCTMNFRYIIFLPVPFALFAGYALQNITPRYKIQSVFTGIFGCFTVICFSLNLIFGLLI